jgi:xanthine dehydrogenase accessory factor
LARVRLASVSKTLGIQPELPKICRLAEHQRPLRTAIGRDLRWEAQIVSKTTNSAPTAKAAAILRMLRDGAREGRRGVLATIVGLTGSGARAVGTHMAVLDNGDSAGSLSSGCVEAAIVAEALDILRDGAPRIVRFGQGSPYIDIRLPCGGGMDVLFVPDPSAEVLERALARLGERQPIRLSLDQSGKVELLPGLTPTPAGWEDGCFSVRHAPLLRLVLLGHGAEMLTSLHLARSFGAEVEIWSPDSQLVELGSALGVETEHLISASRTAGLYGDPWTAFLFLFHDHDWEPGLIAQALDTSAFWVGAMGSPRTQEARRAALALQGVAEEAIARVRGPVGVIPHARDPSTLALSALAEIVSAYGAVAT